MADAAHVITDELIEKIERKISAIYRRAENEIGQSWKAYISEATKEIDELQNAYNAAKKAGDVAEIKKCGRKLSKAKREFTIQNKRFEELTEKTARQLTEVNQRAIAYINGELPKTYTLNYNHIGKEIESKVKGFSFTLTDENTVKRLIMGKDSLLPKRLDIPKDIAWNVQKMNVEVLQGILQGESMDKIAARLQNVTTMNEKAAIRNARTMVTGAENAGRIDGMRQSIAKGVLVQKEWLSATDSRVREWHLELNGKRAEVDEPFYNDFGEIMFPGDPSADGANIYNCRCTLKTKVVGFR